MTTDNKRISQHTILTKHGADCVTWITEVNDIYYDNKEGKKEAVFVIHPNVDYEIMLTEKEAIELKEKIDYFLRGYK